VKPSRGKPHALPVAALKEAHALLVGALPALLADPARLAQAVAHDLLLITVVDALGRSLDDNYGSVKVRLP
jgi:hypothetical protein